MPATFELLSAWNLNYAFTMVWHKPGRVSGDRIGSVQFRGVRYARKGGPTFVSKKAFATCFDTPRGAQSEQILWAACQAAYMPPRFVRWFGSGHLGYSHYRPS
jgi:hypothetical protein